MFQIVDSFDVFNKEGDTEQNPLPGTGRGTWFVLNSDETEKGGEIPHFQFAKITKPNGDVRILKVINAQTRHAVLAVQFENTFKADLPRLSKVEVQVE